MPPEVPIIEPAEVPSLNDLIDETNEQGEEVIEVEPVVPTSGLFTNPRTKRWHYGAEG